MLVEPVAGSPWNGWPDVHGIGGRINVVRALHLLEMLEQRGEARLPRKGFGGTGHWALRIRSPASIQQIYRLPTVI